MSFDLKYCLQINFLFLYSFIYIFCLIEDSCKKFCFDETNLHTRREYLSFDVYFTTNKPIFLVINFNFKFGFHM